MMGVLALSSSTDKDIGVDRVLTYNTNITSARGYIKPGTETPEDFTEMLSATEMLTPFTSIHDDPPRTLMLASQSKHVIPVEKTNRSIFSYGIEKALPNMIGQDFVYRALDDGKVLDVNNELGFIVIQYKDGTKKSINISSNISKNSGGGFYISNTMESNLKKGQTFKKDDILAKNNQYFKESNNEVDYAVGSLTKIAFLQGYYTYEDSCLCTEKFSENMKTYITMKKEVVVEPNSNIDYIIPNRSRVKAGDILLKFEQTFDDENIDKLLDKIGDEYKESITELNKNIVRSKYTGIIEDIKIYYTCDENRFSKSMKKVIDNYENNLKEKKKYLSKFMNENDIDIITTAKYETSNDKVKAVTVSDAVLIEFYIKYEDIMNVGDKATLYSALKTIVGNVVSNDEAPYTIDKNGNKDQVDLIMSPISINARMVASIWLMFYGNKVMIDLKNKVKEIYNN